MVPSRRLFASVFAWTALGVPASLWASVLPVWSGAGTCLLLAAIADALLARRTPPVRVERRAPGVLPVATWQDVTVTIHNEGARALRMELFDDYPAGWDMEGLAHATQVAPQAGIAISYRIRANLRGNASFGPPHLRIVSPLGLWLRTHRVGPGHAVKVFPDFSSILGQTLNATDRRAPSSGSLVKRQRGEGTDFRQLREYRRGDSLRSIDWKATARQRKPIAREYQLERDQQVVFLLDTGRRMLARDGATGHFDHALHAVLTLGFVATKQGDAVGLMAFGEASRWLSPSKGRIGLDRMLAGIYDIQPTETAPDYLRAAEELMKCLSKRAFVVLITNLRDEDDLALRSACQLLSSKHLVMCASLRERALDAVGTTPVEDFAGALRLAATEHYLDQRTEAIRRLGLRHGRVIDVTPERLGVTLLNRYLEIKESGAL
jgi:uncharacterized protein (DUF58 family)